MTRREFQAVVASHDFDGNACVPVSIPVGTTITVSWDDDVPPLDVIRRYLMRAPEQGEWPLEEHCDGMAGGIMLDLMEAGYEIVRRRPEYVEDRVVFRTSDHEPDNPNGVWCCHEHEYAFRSNAKLIDREPQPGDGPDYHADHAAWEERQQHPIVERRSF